MTWIEQLAYSVEVLDKPHGNLVEVSARLSDLDMARAAYPVASRKHPKSFVVLRIKEQILRRSDERA